MALEHLGSTFRQRLQHSLANQATAYGMSARDVEFLLSEFDGRVATWLPEERDRLELAQEPLVRELALAAVDLYAVKCGVQSLV